MSRLGLILQSAEILEVNQRGSVTSLRVVSSGLTERSATRGAKREAAEIIPIPDQTVENKVELGSNRLRQKFMFTISDG